MNNTTTTELLANVTSNIGSQTFSSESIFLQPTAISYKMCVNTTTIIYYNTHKQVCFRYNKFISLLYTLTTIQVHNSCIKLPIFMVMTIIGLLLMHSWTMRCKGNSKDIS